MPINPTSPIKKGTVGPITKPFKVRFDPRAGQTLEQELTGGVNALLALFATAQAQGATGEFDVNPVLSKLTSETPIGGITINGVTISDYVFDQWEIETNESSESLFQCPRIKNNVSANDRAVIARAVADGTSLAAAAAACTADGVGLNWSPVITTFTAPTLAMPNQLYNEMIKGQDAWGPFTYVLRHTSNVSQYSGYNVADNNVNCLYTTAQLLSEVGNASLWTYPIPARLVTKINNIPVESPAPDEADYYLWSWKKSASREQINAQFRVDIVTEYVLALWSTIRYAMI
jgi:hypothetical protein